MNGQIPQPASEPESQAGGPGDTANQSPAPGLQSDLDSHTTKDSGGDWEFWLNPEGRFLYCSQSCEPFTGYAPQQFLDDPQLLARIIHPDDRAAFEAHRRHVTAAKLGGEMDFRIVRPNGSQQWMTHVCRPIFSADGHYLGERSSNRELADRSRLQPVSVSDRPRLPQAAEFLPEAVLSEQSDVRCLGDDAFQRRRAEDLLRRQGAFDSVVTRALADFVSSSGPALDDRIRKSLQEIATFAGVERAFVTQASPDMASWSVTHSWFAAGASTHIAEYQNLPMGTFAWVEDKLKAGEVINCSRLDELPPEAAAMRQKWQAEGVRSVLELPLRGRGGQVRGAIGLLSEHQEIVWMQEDLDRLQIVGDAIATALERKRAEEALRESEEKFRSIVQSSPTAMHLYRVEPDGRLILTGANPTAERVTRVAHQSLLGKTMEEAFPGLASTAIPAMYRQVATGQIGAQTFEIPYQDSRVQGVFQVTVFRVGTASIAVDFADITERKHAEEAMKQAREAAEAASRAKDQFIAVLSHELRTPLTPVLASVSALEMQTNLPPELREDIEAIRRNVLLEARLIDDLLDITRLGRGKIELHYEVVDAHACLNSAMAICLGESRAKHQDVSLDLQADQHHVWADPARLQQVFWNLLNNAIKFTPDHGRITIASCNADQDLQIRITDTGVGIDPDVLPRLFRPFEQAEQTRARRFGGLGLGLTIAKGVMDLHHGQLTVSSPGRDQGATFTATLRTIAPVPVEPPASTRDMATETSGRRILLVEDHADTLRILSRLLRNWGYEVVSADCVHKALEMASAQRVDLLVSDLGLPDGSGLDIMRQLHRQYGLRGIAVSGFGTEYDVRQSHEAGFSQHLTKPLDFRSLALAIRQTVA